MASPSDEVIPHLVVGPTLILEHSGQPVRPCISQQGKGLQFYRGGCAVLSQVLYFARVCFPFFPPWNLPDRQAGQPL